MGRSFAASSIVVQSWFWKGLYHWDLVLPTMRPQKLIDCPKKSKVSRSFSTRIAVTFKTLETEQTAGDKQKALRLFCRAMIRLYLQDHGSPENGKRLGIL